MTDESIEKSMMKSELIERISRKQTHLAYKDVELAVKCLLGRMSNSLSTGERIEIRGFGSFLYTSGRHVRVETPKPEIRFLYPASTCHILNQERA